MGFPTLKRLLSMQKERRLRQHQRWRRNRQPRQIQDRRSRLLRCVHSKSSAMSFSNNSEGNKPSKA
uniref:Uncharacterized protein n=1 Tax=Oryza barthii TaxID=65489 RepID=A0A0D3GA65_9ORYZ